MNIREGKMPFRSFETYYRVVGEINAQRPPLLLLHGGPGSSHNYFEVFDALADQGRCLVMYDQLGCGQSSIPDDPSLWTLRTWLDELAALRQHLGLERVHLLGQSWGGMLAIAYLCDENPAGIASLILSSTLHSASLWEQEGRRQVSYLPQQMQDAIAQAEQAGDYSSAEYQAAEAEYMRRHCFGMPVEQQPECYSRPRPSGRQSYVTAWGNNEFTPTGTLAGFEYGDKLHRINTPTLITSGVYDLCTPLVAKAMFDAIPGAKWELFAHSGHMPFVEENEKYLALMEEWLNANDA